MPIVDIIYCASLIDSLMLVSDLSGLFSPIYLLTRVEQACPTPSAGIKDACIIVNNN